MSASGTVVASASMRFPAACRLVGDLGERLQRGVHVPVRPGRETEEPGSGGTREVVVGPGELERPPGMLGRAGHVAAGLGQ